VVGADRAVDHDAVAGFAVGAGQPALVKDDGDLGAGAGVEELVDRGQDGGWGLA